MLVQPYLDFDGRCDEAIEFYKNKLGAEVEMLMRFKDSPQPHGQGADVGDKVMHASMTIGDSKVMISDGRCAGKPVFSGIMLSLAVADDAKAQQTFAALSDGAR